MEPVTHFLTGACIGRSGLNRRTAYATLAAVLAAEAPDLDVLWAFAGPAESLAHHRGITHTLIAAPVEALAITAFVWFLVRCWATTPWARQRASRPSGQEPQPIRWGWIYISALISTLSHLLLDWTNNYGVRPFFPFDKHWYSGDLVFIGEPIIWALLLIALIFPALLSLADREMGARRTRFRGRAWALFALTGMVLLWCWRWAEHAQAQTLVAAAQVTQSPIRRIALEPYPGNPFRWHALIETADTWQTAEVDTRTASVESDPRTNSLFKPPITPALEVARRTRLGEVYLDWSQWPVVRDLGQQTIPGTPAPDFPSNRPWTTIQFSDLRFAYSPLDMSMTGGSDQRLNQILLSSPLAAWVYVLDGKEEAGQFMNGREQK